MQLYNSLRRRKEALQPIEPGHVRLYVCGMTVYDYCHLGHARVMVTFDTLVRALRATGMRVTYVRNVTDIDDKIIRRANERGEPFQALTEFFIQAMHEDERALKVLPPDLEPKATEHIDTMQEMIATLIEKGHAYPADNGDVYYAVRSFANYGALSGRSLDDLAVGARVEPGEAKRDPLDFALWKHAKPDEPHWTSAWGDGRPGWHIECSAMSTKALGPTFDIHGGGADLRFPHHENEIAQSEGATGCTFANLWMHNGFVEVNEEKMSKSLGNFFTIRELLSRYSGEVLRYFIISSHYRSPLQYTTDNIDAAKSALDRLYTALRGRTLDPDLSLDALAEPLLGYRSRFFQALEDDLNTPEARAVLAEIAHGVHKADEKEADALASLLKALGGVLGVLQEDPERWFQGDDGGALDAVAVEEAIAQRLAAKKAKNFSEADRIRDDLKAKGILLEDGPQGTIWRRG